MSKKVLFFTWLVVVGSFLTFSFSTMAQEDRFPDEDIEDDTFIPPPPSPDEEEPAIEEPADPAATKEAVEKIEDVIEEEKGEATPGAKKTKISIDAAVIVDYTLAGTEDQIRIKYSVSLGGMAENDRDTIKGNAKIVTDISGYLAKWPTGECVLKVSIADVPYTIDFRGGDLDVELDKAWEGWESQCMFLDAPGAKFNTSGEPEVWLSTALEKARPSLSRLSTSYSAEKASTLIFDIPQYTIEEENLGKAVIKGKGVVTIQPENVTGGSNQDITKELGYKPLPKKESKTTDALTKKLEELAAKNKQPAKAKFPKMPIKFPTKKK